MNSLSFLNHVHDCEVNNLKMLLLILQIFLFAVFSFFSQNLMQLFVYTFIFHLLIITFVCKVYIFIVYSKTELKISLSEFFEKYTGILDFHEILAQIQYRPKVFASIILKTKTDL